MRIHVVNALMDPLSYMSIEYIKHFGKIYFIIFGYILVHGRMLEKYSQGLEAMPCAWVEQSLHINLLNMKLEG